MSILDSILGGGGSDEQSTNSSSQTQDFDSVFATSPASDLQISDVLQSSDSSSDEDGTDSSSFTGIGDVGLDLSAPTLLGISSSSSDEQFSSRDSDGNGGGGLLGGLI